jgi:hypothetical protein
MQSLPDLVEVTIIAKQPERSDPPSRSLIVPLTRAGGDITALETGAQAEGG